MRPEGAAGGALDERSPHLCGRGEDGRSSADTKSQSATAQRREIAIHTPLGMRAQIGTFFLCSILWGSFLTCTAFEA